LMFPVGFEPDPSGNGHLTNVVKYDVCVRCLNNALVHLDHTLGTQLAEYLSQQEISSY
jgi:hypothetical protein